LGLPFEFYAIDRYFFPSLPDGIQRDDAVIVIDYFGSNRLVVNKLIDQLDASLIIDATQAFLNAAPDDVLFNSTRKFFGVPDGAYL